METLTGKSASKGHVIAAAALITDGDSLLSFNPERLKRIAVRAGGHDEPFEDEEHVILVSRTYPAALLRSEMPGVVVVGLAIAEPYTADPNAPHIPIVTSLGEELMHSMSEDDLLILDANTGRLYVQPDAMTVAAYQETQRTKDHFDLGQFEPAALTSEDGRLISLSARVSNFLDIYTALDSGVDGLFITSDNELLPIGPKGAPVDDQVKALARLSSTIGRVPLYLQIPLEQIAFAALSQAACECSLHVVIDQPEIVNNLITQLKFVEAGLAANNMKFGPLYFDALLSTTSPDGLSLESLNGFAGVVISDDLNAGSTESLVMIGAIAHHANKPAVLSLPKEHWYAPLEQAMMLGLTGFVAFPENLVEIKQAIRSL